MKPGAKNIALTAGITALAAAVCAALFWFFIWPLYRDGHRRSISEGLRMPLNPPVVAGHVAADGSVVVSAELDALHKVVRVP